jgi:uncharacterized membrane protein YcaP (DUF421 family)
MAVLRTIYLFVLLLVLTHLIGRKLISQMTFFDFLIGITLGPIGAHLALGKSVGMDVGLTVLTVLTALTIISALVTIRSRRWQKLIGSEPVVMIANGKIVRENMGKVRLTMNDLLMMLREKNVFNINDVEFALMETDGKISILKKSQKEPLTPENFNLPTTYKGLTKDLIMDGHVLKENLRDINLDQSWLDRELTTKGFGDPSEVFYAGLDTEGKLFISAKIDNRGEKPGKYGID